MKRSSSAKSASGSSVGGGGGAKPTDQLDALMHLLSLDLTAAPTPLSSSTAPAQPMTHSRYVSSTAAATTTVVGSVGVGGVVGGRGKALKRTASSDEATCFSSVRDDRSSGSLMRVVREGGGDHPLPAAVIPPVCASPASSSSSLSMPIASNSVQAPFIDRIRKANASDADSAVKMGRFSGQTVVMETENSQFMQRCHSVSSPSLSSPTHYVSDTNTSNVADKVAMSPKRVDTTTGTMTQKPLSCGAPPSALEEGGRPASTTTTSATVDAECSTCDIALSQRSFFVLDGAAYCEICFNGRLNMCHECRQPISGRQVSIKEQLALVPTSESAALDADHKRRTFHFHTACFNCFICKTSLLGGSSIFRVRPRNDDTALRNEMFHVFCQSCFADENESCFVCLESLERSTHVTDFVALAPDAAKKVHLGCFKCCRCNAQLIKCANFKVNHTSKQLACAQCINRG